MIPHKHGAVAVLSVIQSDNVEEGITYTEFMGEWIKSLYPDDAVNSIGILAIIDLILVSHICMCAEMTSWTGDSMTSRFPCMVDGHRAVPRICRTAEADRRVDSGARLGYALLPVP